MRTHAKETTVIQDLASPATSSTLSSMPLPNNKQNKNTKQTGLPPHSALPIRGKTNKQKLSTNLTLQEDYINHWTNLRRAEAKRKKEFNLEACEKETSNTIS